MSRGCLPLLLLAALALPSAAGVDLDGDDYYMGLGTPINGYPHTLECWVNANSLPAGGSSLVSCADKDSAANYTHLALDSTGRVYAQTTSAVAYSTTTLSVGSWHHACAVQVSNTDHRAFLDGAGKGTSVTNQALAPGIDRVGIGALVRSSIGIICNAKVALAIIRSVALSDEEVVASMRSPFGVRPASIVFICLLDVHDPAGPLDIVGGLRLSSVVGDPVTVETPPRPRQEPQQSYYLDLRHPDLFDEEVFRAA